MSGTRLNKYIASSGLCSRRKADELIEAGVEISLVEYPHLLHDKFCIVDQKTDTIVKDYGYVEPFSDEHFVCQQYAYMYLGKTYPNWEDPLEYWEA